MYCPSISAYCNTKPTLRFIGQSKYMNESVEFQILKKVHFSEIPVKTPNNVTLNVTHWRI